jgi:hypothetical protein
VTDAAPLHRHGEWLLVALLLLVGGLLRLWALDSNPPGTFRDEWEKGYTALELWQTGRHGVLGAEGVRVSYPAPLFIEVFEGHDRTSAIYQWVAAPVVGIFGLNETTTRIPAAFAGFACLIVGWCFARRDLGVAGALVVLAALATQPTLVLFSRWAQQGILSIVFFMAGIAVMVAAPSHPGRPGRLHALGAAVLLGLAAWAYDPARLTIPLVVAVWFVAFGWRQRRDVALTLALCFGALWLPLFVYTLTAGSARLSRVMLDDSGSLISALINYLSHFDPRFWFITGDANPRHALPFTGWSGRITGVLALVGIGRAISLAARRQSPGEWPILGLVILLAAPIAAALTREGNPHALRSGIMLVGLVMLAGYGAAWWIGRARESIRALLLVIAITLIVDGGATIRGLGAQRNESQAWEAGLIPTLRESLAAPGNVYLASEVMYAPYAALFAEQTNPADWQEKGLAALRIRIVPLDTALRAMQHGDVVVGPPRPPMRLEWLAHPQIQYGPGILKAWSAEDQRLVPLEP